MLLNTKLTTKISWYFWSVTGICMVCNCMLSSLRHCTSKFQRGSPWNGCFSLFIDIFLPLLPFPSPLLTPYDRCLDDCMGSHGWVAGITSHGSITLSGGRLVTVEVPGYPNHPSSIQHDAALWLLTWWGWLSCSLCCWVLSCSAFCYLCSWWLCSLITCRI